MVLAGTVPLRLYANRRNGAIRMAVPQIAVFTHTGLLRADLIKAWVAAAQVALDRDFAPHWSGATLRYVLPGGAIHEDEWQLVFFDHSDQADALGYHALTPAGQPQMKVFVKDCIDGGLNWNTTGSHELYETIVDPYLNRTVTVGDTEYALEVCDAPEDDSFAVRVAGHMASNAVTPAWFNPDGKPPFTIYPCPAIMKPLELAPGGYIGVRPIGGIWSQKFPNEARTARQIKGVASRTMRRFMAA